MVVLVLNMKHLVLSLFCLLAWNVKATSAWNPKRIHCPCESYTVSMQYQPEPTVVGNNVTINCSVPAGSDIYNGIYKMMIFWNNKEMFHLRSHGKSTRVAENAWNWGPHLYDFRANRRLIVLPPTKYGFGYLTSISIMIVNVTKTFSGKYRCKAKYESAHNLCACSKQNNFVINDMVTSASPFHIHMGAPTQINTFIHGMVTSVPLFKKLKPLKKMNTIINGVVTSASQFKKTGQPLKKITPTPALKIRGGSALNIPDERNTQSTYDYLNLKTLYSKTEGASKNIALDKIGVGIGIGIGCLLLVAASVIVFTKRGRNKIHEVCIRKNGTKNGKKCKTPSHIYEAVNCQNNTKKQLYAELPGSNQKVIV